MKWEGMAGFGQGQMNSQCSFKIAALSVHGKDLSTGPCTSTDTLCSSCVPPTFLVLGKALYQLGTSVYSSCTTKRSHEPLHSLTLEFCN